MNNEEEANFQILLDLERFIFKLIHNSNDIHT